MERSAAGPPDPRPGKARPLMSPSALVHDEVQKAAGSAKRADPCMLAYVILLYNYALLLYIYIYMWGGPLRII